MQYKHYVTVHTSGGYQRSVSRRIQAPDDAAARMKLGVLHRRMAKKYMGVTILSESFWAGKVRGGRFTAVRRVGFG